MKSPDKARRFLTHNAHLQKLLQTSRSQMRIFNFINQLLPDQLKSHCLGANLDDQQLTLFADSSIWASRLRYESHNLQQQLREKNLPVQKIAVRVQMPDRAKPAPRKKPARPALSSATSAMLKQTAESIEDPALADALKRLAKHKLS